MDALFFYKLFSVLIIWVLGFFGGILPFFIRTHHRSLVNLLNCFSGGIFLAGGFLHLLPDAIHHFKSMTMYPYAELFCTIGFLLIFLIEQMSTVFSSDGKEASKKKHSPRDPLTRTGVQNEKEEPLISIEENRTPPESPSPAPSPAHLPLHEDLHTQIPGQSSSFIVSIVLFVALSFHSILEGLGVGAQTRPAYNILMAIVFHKGLAGFALGTSLLRSDFSIASFFIYITLFSLMSVIGLLIGWLLSARENEDSFSTGVCVALASGTFIYVAVMEVIPKEFEQCDKRYATVALLVGYASFAVLALWA